MKCLIVDDEYSARQSLVIMGRYQELGIDTILEAEDGDEAMRIVEEEKPEIIITDMKMGKMDGDAFLQSLPKSHYHPQVLVISGFSDYKYMHSALYAGAIDYILKPIGIDRFNKCLEQAVSRYIERNKVTISDDQIRSLLTRMEIHNAAEDELESYPLVLDFVEKADTYRVFLLRIQAFDDVCSERFNSMPDLLFYALQCQLEEDMPPDASVLLLRLIEESNDLVGIISFGSDSPKRDPVKLFQTLLQRLMDKQAVLGVIGLSEDGRGLPHISTAYRQARTALRQTHLTHQPLVCTRNTMIPPAQPAPGVDEQQFSTLLHAGRIDEIMSCISTALDDMVANKAYTLHHLEYFTLDLVQWFNTMSKNKNADQSAPTNADIKSLLKTIRQYFANPTRVAQELRAGFEPLANRLAGKLGNMLIQEMCEYIDRSYTKHIQLKTLSERFYISREYASRVFKKELNTTFVNYLTDVRLKNVCKLLLTTQISVSSIAYESGFRDVGYMIRVFKKAYGLTPREYREGKH